VEEEQKNIHLPIFFSFPVVENSQENIDENAMVENESACVTLSVHVFLSLCLSLCVVSEMKSENDDENVCDGSAKMESAIVSENDLSCTRRHSFVGVRL